MKIEEDLLLDNEFMDLLDPHEIKEHAEIIDAIFEFYLKLSYEFESTYEPSNYI